MRVSGRRISILSHFTKRRFWQIAMLTAPAARRCFFRRSRALLLARLRPELLSADAADAAAAQKCGPAAKAVAAERKPAAAGAADHLGLDPEPEGADLRRQRIFAESPISTGMAATRPRWAYSIIQKHKFHHSKSIGAPRCRAMQRITWSGVAMHAGVLPGYRRPTAGPHADGIRGEDVELTKMGARVIVTPGEITPANFSHPLLVTQKEAQPSRRRVKVMRRSAPRAKRASMPDLRPRRQSDLRGASPRRGNSRADPHG
jgi:hypothetical protein